MFDEIYEIEAEEADYLFVDRSQIPNAGKGLFTAIKIFKSEIIAVFKGEILTDEEAALRAHKFENAYFISMLNGSIMDSACVDGFAKYANDPNGVEKSNFKINALITIDDEERICLVAKRNIEIGEEIFCSYGKEYWKTFKLN